MYVNIFDIWFKNLLNVVTAHEAVFVNIYSVIEIGWKKQTLPLARQMILVNVIQSLRPESI